MMAFAILTIHRELSNGYDILEITSESHSAEAASPLLATVPLQIFACEVATLLGHDVDQPRNLAKSVTVE